jgi:hypothetical protein
MTAAVIAHPPPIAEPTMAAMISLLMMEYSIRASTRLQEPNLLLFARPITEPLANPDKASRANDW